MQHRSASTATLKPVKLIQSTRLSTQRHRTRHDAVRRVQQEAVRDEILHIARPSTLPGGAHVDRNELLKERINLLIANPETDQADRTLRHGQGTWEVIHAPHITGLSRKLGTSFAPIRYILRGNRIVSNVQYSSSIFREGWLSASGKIEPSGTNTLQISFDKFWIDFGSTKLREELQGEGSTFDKFINALGKLGFIQQFSYFPVQYMDPGGQLAVFSFPPLKSNITIMRVK